ncbi:hypothetical protein [Paenibacillus sp. ACRRY]|uniref:hypothetical protein n=1 Tax=Paenibacillus sp. ACRRY TaxID=2918208 RepID=UPI001EF6A687|nr:hypothetical protein [Paenibacillus sp. ACRRY]MCG7383323.1 hypothetical protein [Paenibacillus sp. ACRRY]
MKILIGQPKLEQALDQLERELSFNPEVDIVLYPEGYLNQNVEEARRLAAKYETIIVSGHRRLDERPKDRAIIMNKAGDIVLEKAKYTPATTVEEAGWLISTLLCDELVRQGFRKEFDGQVHLIMHSIGVGMFSEEQYTEWLEEARQIAIAEQCVIMGTSHADGAYRDSDISIPIAYCVAPNGDILIESRNDTRSRVIELKSVGKGQDWKAADLNISVFCLE